MFNPSCGLDVYETCDENTWVQCKLASARLGRYVFGLILVIVMIIIFFATDSLGKIIVVAVGLGLFLLMRFGADAWISSTARVEYQRAEREIEGMRNRGDMTRKEAMKELRAEKLSREHTSAIRDQNRATPAATGLAGFTVGVATGLMNRGK
jgi:hypothetical protein